MKYIFKLTLLVFVLTLFYPFASVKAAGATLFLSPSSGSFEIGKTFTVKAMVNSGGGIGINASDGSIKYDTDLLTLLSITKTGSVFNLWTKEPISSGGSISYGGGSPSAYTGTAGAIFNISFKAKKIGEATVSFTSGKAIQAGPPFADLVSGLGSAKFSIIESKKEEPKPKVKPKKEEEKEEPKATGILPPLPDVESKTHPDEDVWYQDNEPEFNWKVLADLTGVSFGITDEADSNPGETSDGIVETYIFEKQEDGEHYFHIKYQNKNGWSKIAHRKLLIDSTPPNSFKLKVDNGGDETEPAPKLKFKVEDASSGIDYYNIKIDNKTEKVAPSSVKDGYYQLGILAPGDHIAQVIAVDRASNVASSSINFIVTPLKSPIITSIPEQINKKEELVIQGKSFYPQVTIKISITGSDGEPKEYSTKTDDEGNWSYFHKGILEKGSYEITARVVDNRGAQSYDSASKILIVVSPSIIDSYGFLIILLLLIIIAGLIAYILYLKKSFRIEKLRIKSETEEVKMKLRKIFSALREEVDELIQLADRKPGLSESERKVKEKLQESLDISEEFISKEIEDVEKEINIKDKKKRK
ncbi:hypothetical protein KAI92_04390 [Candidatus Parcubacteria bacterium]|nr:hypothetical protein [Candidatus Parcubacteria bacterium]